MHKVYFEVDVRLAKFNRNSRYRTQSNLLISILMNLVADLSQVLCSKTFERLMVTRRLVKVQTQLLCFWELFANLNSIERQERLTMEVIFPNVVIIVDAEAKKPTATQLVLGH